MRPTEIRILAKPYTVAPMAHGAGMGAADHRTQSIQIAAGQGHEQERDTLLHEVIHAIDYALHADLEERQVHALSAGLLAVLRENPEFVEWLTSNA